MRVYCLISTWILVLYLFLSIVLVGLACFVVFFVPGIVQLFRLPRLIWGDFGFISLIVCDHRVCVSQRLCISRMNKQDGH